MIPPDQLSEVATAAIGEQLDARLRALARRRQWLTGARASLLVAGLVLVTLAVVMMTDRLLVLPYAIRLTALVVWTVALAILVRAWVLRPWRRLNDPSARALWVEAAAGITDNTLVSASQVQAGPADGPTSQTLRAQLLATALDAVARLSPATLVPMRPVFVAAGRFLLLASIALILASWAAHGSVGVAARLLGRAMALPGIRFPYDTRIDVMDPLPLFAPAGEQWSIHFRVEGKVPSPEQLQSGHVNVRYMTDQRVAVPLSVQPGKPSELTAIVDTSGPLQIQAELADGRTDWIPVSIVPRPTAKDLVITVLPPPYTGLHSQPLQPKNPFVPAGSRLAIRFETDASPALSMVTFSGLVPAPSYRVQPDPDAQRRAAALGGGVGRALCAIDGTQASVPVPLTATAVVVRLRDVHGIEGLPVIVPLAVVPDAPPIIDLSASPPWPEMSTVSGQVRLRGSASDDYGVSTLALAYVVVPPEAKPAGVAISASADSTPNAAVARLMAGATPEATGLAARRVNLETGEGRRKMQIETDWPLTTAGARSGDTIVWWLMAEDGAGNSTQSSRQRVVVADVAGVQRYLTGVMGRQLETLEGGARQQQSLADEVAQLLQGSPSTRPTPGAHP